MRRLLLFLLATNIIALLNKFVIAKFPEDPKPCKYEDAKCIKKFINYIMSEKSGGDSSMGLVSIDPLSVPKVSIKQGEESPVNIDLKFSDNKIYGVKKSTAVKIKGFGKDLTQKHEVHMKAPSIQMTSDYSIVGKVLILPISGTGKSNITLVNPQWKMTFSGTPLVRNDKQYMKFDNMKLDVIPERIIFYFGNLFNGDKELGDTMNKFLNDNWKDIYAEIETSFTNAFAQIFTEVINSVFQKYPYEQFFAKE